MKEDNQAFLEEFQFVMTMVFNFFMLFSITVEVFLRRKFGERYFSGFLFSFATLFIFAFAMSSAPILLLIGTKAASNDMQAMVIAAFAFLGFSLWHQISIYRRSKRGEWWHSRCGGLSWGIWSKIFRCGEDKVQMYIEPIFCLAVSFALIPVSNTLSMWLFWASISLLISARTRTYKSFILKS